ncbi:alpha-ketoacid dehydrogenase subunit beta [Candidatus Hecatella orcuttiae]|uniref:alpha-ketoacid dehydrogenase subunit beta n=1 Tax=Candidatus Hecatella orcuttiae TaxID=1935119 RepID=UPI003184260C
MRQLSLHEAVNDGLKLEMERDPTVFIMGEDIALYGGAFFATHGLLEKFGPERVRDTPISEAAFTGIAFGAAITGLRPVVDLMFADFIGLAMDQILNQIAQTRYIFGGQVKVPLTIRASIGAGVSAAAHHSQCLYSMFAHTPGLKVVVPSTPYDAKGLLISAIRDDNPVIFLEHKSLGVSETYRLPTAGRQPVPEEAYTIPLGVADIKREGKDVTVVAVSLMVHKALEAAEKLVQEGISLEVIDPRTLVPLDKEAILKSVRKTRRLIIMDEDRERCGFASEVAALVADEAFFELEAPIKRIATPNIPIPFSPILESTIIPSTQSLIRTVREVVGK